MKTTKPQAWSLASKSAFGQLLERFAGHFVVQHHAGKVQQITVLDNFDWALWHAGSSLVHLSGRHYLLMTNAHEVAAQSHTQPARFWWDFPEGELQNRLKKLSPLRALLPIASVRYAVHRYDLLNADEKTVVRLKLVQHYSAETEQSRKIIGAYLEATPLLGYTDEFEQVVNIIQTANLPPTPLPNVQQLCIAQGVTVREKPSKAFAIDADMPAEKAVRKMGRQILALALSQRTGLLDDIDTEFLHQYRVNLRKLRSLISLLKKTLDQNTQETLQAALAELFSPTNQLRDLDVFLLERNYYQSLLPSELAPGLEVLFNHITRERQRCQKTTVRALRSRQYQQKVSTVEGLLAAEAKDIGVSSGLPIGKLARKRILARYRKVCAIGKGIDAATPDEEVHALRKECKKLRYLMEFFAELFPKKTIASLIKQLKRLQDILGQFNDYSVQQAFLMKLGEKEHSAKVLASINGLVAVLHQHQVAARAEVQQAFKNFSAAETTTMFESLSFR